MSDASSKSSESTGAEFIARVLLLLVVLTVWGAITIGIAFDVAEGTTSYQYLTVVIFLFLSQLWGLRTISLFSQE